MFKSYRKIKRNMNKVTKPVKKIERSVKKMNRFTTLTRNQAEKRIERETAIRTKPIANMDGYYFEDYLAKLFKDLGYPVERTNSRGDFGADLILYDQGRKIIIQAKRYSSKVGIRAVQEITAAQKYYGADSMTVVKNNFFTRAAKELASINDVMLIDGRHLMDMVSKRDMMKEEVPEQKPTTKPKTKPKIKREGGFFARLFNR